MTKTKTKLKFPKFYICERGVFYEGQTLAHYCSNGKTLYYVDNVVLEKFIVHYHNYMPALYFRILEKKYKRFTLPVEQLGIFYKKLS